MTTQYYRDFNRPDVELLARAICVEQNLDPDGLVKETGSENAALMPLWWRYQFDALKFIAMTKARAA
jgi:hypothetical protein